MNHTTQTTQLQEITGLPLEMCQKLLIDAGNSLSVAVELALDMPKEVTNEGLAMVSQRLHPPTPTLREMVARKVEPKDAKEESSVDAERIIIQAPRNPTLRLVLIHHFIITGSTRAE